VTTTGITYSTTSACPAGDNGSGIVRLIDPENPNTESASTNLTPVNNNVSAPFSGTFNSTFATIEQIFPDVVGAVSEVAVYCFSGPSATGTAVVVQDAFVPASTGTVTLTVNAAPANPGTIPLAVTVPATGAFTLTVDTTDAITLMMNGNGSGTATGASISANQLGWTRPAVVRRSPKASRSVRHHHARRRADPGDPDPAGGRPVHQRAEPHVGEYHPVRRI
jgi:hypothetical protein